MVVKVQTQIALIVLSLASMTRCDLVTALDPIGTPTFLGDAIYTVNWDSGCNYLATGGYIGDFGLVGVYQYNQAIETLSLTGTTTFGYDAFSVKWRPSSNFLAVAGDGSYDNHTRGMIQVYNINSTVPVLDPVGTQTVLGSFVYSIDWDASGSYLAAGGWYINFSSGTNNGIIQVYHFDSIAGLSTVGSPVNFSTPIKSLNWCSNGLYLAAVDSMQTVYVYTFDHVRGLINPTSYVSTTSYNSVNWCGPCGYIAAGGHNGSTHGVVDVYTFDSTRTSSILFDQSVTVSSELNYQVYSLKWCQDCDNLAVSAATLEGTYAILQLYHFIGSPQTLSLVQTLTLDFSFYA